MAEIIGSIALKVTESSVAPITRHLRYFFHHRHNSVLLLAEVKELRAMWDDVRRAVEEARRRGDEIRPIVQDWLNRVDQITGEVEELMEFENQSCFNGRCPNLKSRYQLGREAYEKMQQVIDEIEVARKFRDGISYRVPLRSITFKNYEPFESRASTLNKIMDALRDDKIQRIGVWGMGGVGKTTLVKQVAQLARQEMLFTTEVYVCVSLTGPQEGIAKIQKEIADAVGFEFEGRDESTRAAELLQRLKRDKILIILDDIWKEVDLEEAGIPSEDGQENCKILLASRDLHLLCKDMGTQTYFPVESLPLEEAWSLFKNQAGESLEKNLGLQDIAIEVVKECQGLPIAIKTIARALNGRSLSVWRIALKELRESSSINIRGMGEIVLPSLKLSYDNLEGEEVKLLFLLCGIGGDGDISVDYLLKYGIGLGLFVSIDSLKQARNRLVTLVKILKDSSLLHNVEDGQSNEPPSLFFGYDHNMFVKMHRFVCDIARAIASEDPHRFMVKEALHSEEWPTTEDFSKFTGILLKCRDNCVLPDQLVCPKLELFLLNSNYSSLRIPEAFFTKMEKLKVLDLSKTCLTSLPSSLCFLPNLRTLCLDYCQLRDTAIIGELKKLQILSFVGSTIEQLPKEIMQLIDLRLLDLRNCSYLRVIPQKVISSLRRLEGLLMENSFTQWEVEGFHEGEANARLSELKHLPFLWALEVKVPDPNLLPLDMLFDSWSRYRILVGQHWTWHHTYRASRMLKLSKVKRLHLLNCFSKLLKRIEDLELEELDDTKHVVNELEEGGFIELKHLHIHDSPGIQYIINSTDEWAASDTAFPILEGLHLQNLINLDAVCRGPIPMGCFGNLRILHVGSCKELQYLFVLPIGQRMELTFPQLRSLSLVDLPKLTNFYGTGTCSESNEGSQKIDSENMLDASTSFFNQLLVFPKLEVLEIFYMEKIKKIWHGQLSTIESLGNLKEIRVSHCASLSSVFPTSTIPSLLELEILEIDSCGIKEIFAEEDAIETPNKYVPEFFSDEDSIGMPNRYILPKLTDLILKNLKEFKNLYTRKCISEWPLLKRLEVRKCGDMDILFQELVLEDNLDNQVQQPFFLVEKLAFPKLEILVIFHMENLKKIWHDQLSTIESFGHLKEIRVSNCANLSSVSTTSVGGFLQLETLEIDSCGVEEIFVEEIFVEEDGIETLAVVLFPKLTYLTLMNLKELNCFYKGKHILEWASLKKLKVCNCDKVEILFQEIGHEANLDNQVQPPLFLVEKLTFPQLEILEIFQMENMKKIWLGQLSTIVSLDCLKEIRLSHCGNLLSVFPTSVIQALLKLETLEIDSCGIQEIFGKEEEIEPVTEVIFPKLTLLILKNLEELKCFYHGKHLSKWALLKKLEVCNCDKVEILFQEISQETNSDKKVQQPFFLVEKLAFPKLEILEIFQMENIKKIWHGQLSTTQSFGHLKEIRVSNCQNLSSVCLTSVIRCLLELETIEIDSCGMEEIFVGEDGTIAEITFPKLTYLKLKNLRELKCLCKEKHISTWTSLKRLEISKCDKLEILFQDLNQGADRDKQVQKPLFLVGEAAFPNLEDLDISNLDSVEKIWHNEFTADSFGKLKGLYVRSCQKLRNLIPSNMLRRLSSLQTMKIEDCNSVGEVFDMEARDRKESHDIPVLQLRELCLESLKNLKYIWNEAPEGLLTYQNLKSVQVSHCPSLKIPFPGYVVRSLLQVKRLGMASRGVEEIVAPEDVAKIARMFLFPEVKSLTTSCLEEIKCIYLGLHTLEWPMLKKLEVESSKSLEILASELDKTVEQYIFLCDEVSFPNLEYLNLSLKLKEIQDLQVLFRALSNLQILIIENCPFLLKAFSSNFIQSLNNLKKLTVKNCNLLEEIFDLKRLDHGDVKQVEMLSELEELSLIDLPKLRYICNDCPPQVLSFQKLKLLQVKQCDNLVYLFSSSMGRGLVQLQNLCVEHCSTMKKIIIEDGNEDNRAKQVSSLQNLKLVRVKNCDSLMHLFPSSFAQALLQLQDLRIEHCDMMKEIVTAGEGVTEEINFPQITRVSLVQLPKLTSFYLSQTAEKIGSGESNTSPGVLFNEKVSFPSLEELNISNLDMIEKIWHDEFISDSFGKLKRFCVTSCKKMLRVIPSNMLKKLSSLQILKIEDCNSVKEVFDLGALDRKESHDIPVLQLRELYLKSLNNLKYIWTKAPQGLLTYPNLKPVKVSHCPSLAIPFPGYVVRSLLQLKELDTNSCAVLEEIVAYEEVTNEVTMFLFPEVTSLESSCLNELNCFYVGLDTLDWPMLKTLEIESCESLEILTSELDKTVEQSIFLCHKAAFPSLEVLNLSVKVEEIQHLHLLFGALFNLKTLIVESCPFLLNLFSFDFIKSLKSLKNLKVKECHRLQGVFDLDGVDHNEGEHAEVLSRLEELKLIDLPVLKSICKNSPPKCLCFRKLKLLEVKQCGSLMHLFSSSMALGLVQLQYICIEHCSKVEHIVVAEEGVTDKINFPHITRVSLLKLPKLESFYQRTQTPGVLFNEEVAFPQLEFLYVSGLYNVKKIWHNQLLANSFSKLKETKVENCNELQNISSSNVMKWLSCLEVLKISNCSNLKEVFELEEMNFQEDVADNQLSQLILDDLENLEHICHKVHRKRLLLQTLKLLKVHNCVSLKKLFSSYKELEGDKEIIRQEEGAQEVIDKIEFPELTSLSLKLLPSLASFYPGDHDTHSTVLFNDKVTFPSLKSLEISGLGSMKKIWYNKLIDNSFGTLEKVKVENCNELPNVLSSNMLKGLPSLHVLSLVSCSQLKVVFDLEGADVILEDVTETELNHMVLQDLPQLQYIWNKDPYGILTFKKLDFVEIFGCDGLKSHFPVGSLVRDLSQLEKQLIRSRGTEGFGEKDEGEGFVFPEVIYDKLLDPRKIKGKEVVKADDDVSEISEDMPGSSG